MFELLPQGINHKIFNLKSTYLPEENFNYTLEVYNHISKTGFTIDLVDINPWISGVTNTSTLSVGSVNTFNSGISYNINTFGDYTFIFNNTIQIDGVDYQFTDSTGLTSVKSTMLNNNYVICFGDTKGKISIVDKSGNTLTGFTFNNNPVLNINIHSFNNDSVVIGYYDTVLGISLVKEIRIYPTIVQYDATMFYNGKANELRINKISDAYFVLTYNTDTKGIIQVCKTSIDHIFSVGFPFVFNNDNTLFSNSVYLNGNVVVVYYDVDDQLKIRNCKLYDDYIGIGNPTIIKGNYCYDLNIGKLDDNYVYVTYYDGENLVTTTSIVRINEESIVVGDTKTITGWTEGMFLTTIDSKNYFIAYMNSGQTGVYQNISITGGTLSTYNQDYNEFNIDISTIDVSKNGGHNDYTIYYGNEIVEKGVLYIKNYTQTYNV